jgi:hypothetical protein
VQLAVLLVQHIQVSGHGGVVTFRQLASCKEAHTTTQYRTKGVEVKLKLRSKLTNPSQTQC